MYIMKQQEYLQYYYVVFICQREKTRPLGYCYHLLCVYLCADMVRHNGARDPPYKFILQGINFAYC